MAEPGDGEQCTVVFALIVTEPATECLCVGGGGGGGCYSTLPALPGSVTIYAKTTVHCYPDSSMEFPLLSSFISELGTDKGRSKRQPTL